MTFIKKNLFIATLGALLFGFFFYLITYRFYFIINSFSPDEFNIDFFLIRNFILIIFPTFIGLYISLNYSSKSLSTLMSNISAIILVLFLGYIGIRPHQLGFIYVLFIGLLVFIVFDGQSGFLLVRRMIHQKKRTYLLKVVWFFIVGALPMVIILILSWPTLYKGVGNKFIDQFDNVSRE